MSSHQVSVIISAYNAANTLEACLDSLSKQTLDHQLIIVDDGSTDTTPEIIAKYPYITYIKTNHLGPAPARNRGAAASEGTILVFVDADMVFDKNFLNLLIAPIIDQKSPGTWTKEEKVLNWENAWAKAWNLEYTKNLTPYRVPQNHPDEGPVFRAILKTEFDKVGGFDITGYTDDWTLAQKLGYKPLAAKGAVMYHANPASIARVWKQAKWTAKRPYKFNQLGRGIAIVRALFPFSLLIGLVKAVKYNLWTYLPFKIIYDLAIIVGICEYWLTGKSAK